MTLTFLIIITILLAVNIVITFTKKTEIDIKPQLKDIETSMQKFDNNLERTEKSINEDAETHGCGVQRVVSVFEIGDQ